ncbi:hypothetical protein JCM3765_000974 [Sporobolomyces pararoseus]
MSQPHSPGIAVSPRQEPRSTSPTGSSSSTPHKRSGRWTKEEEMDLLLTTHRVKGPGTTDADWERVRSSLSTVAKNRSLAAVRQRFNLLEGTAKKNKIKTEQRDVKPQVSDLVIESEDSQSREGSFYGGWGFAIEGGGLLPLGLSQQDLQRAASPRTAPSHVPQVQTMQANQLVSQYSDANFPLWSIDEDAVLLGTLVLDSNTLRSWHDVQQLAVRTFSKAEGGHFEKTPQDCRNRYFTVLHSALPVGDQRFAAETVSKIEYTEFQREQLSQYAFGRPFIPSTTLHQTMTSFPPIQNHYSSTSFPAQQTFHSTPALVVPSSSTEPPRTRMNQSSELRAAPGSSSDPGQAIPPFLNRSSFVFQDSHPFSASTNSNRRHSMPSQVGMEDTTTNLGPRRQTLAPSFTFSIPRVEVREPEPQPQPDQLATSAVAFSEHGSRHPQKVALVPSIDPSPSNTRPSLPSTVSRNPQRLLTPQDPAELERFPSPSIVPSTSTSNLATSSPVVSSSQPQLPAQAQTVPSRSSSLLLSPPVSPEISQGNVRLSASAKSSPRFERAEQTSTATESARHLNRIELNTSSENCALSEVVELGLGIMFSEEDGRGGDGGARGIKRELMETGSGFGMKESGSGDGDAKKVKRPSPPSAKRGKVEFVEMREDEEEKK